MRIAVLTTNSVRRRRLVQALQEFAPVERVFIETREPKAPFETAHPFEKLRKAHEAEKWFGGAPPAFADIADVAYYESLNAPEAVSDLRAMQPDAIIVFGTGKLSREVIAISPQGSVNLHGGDPEEYRGLDVPLWTVYHGDFAALATTVQILAPDIDCGDIVARRPVSVAPGMRLHELRRAATDAAVDAIREAVGGFKDTGRFEGREMMRRGRYYSFMPAVMKQLCVERFERFSDRLDPAA